MSKILMYHGIVPEMGSGFVDRERGADLYDVKIDAFKEHLNWLQHNSYRFTVNLNADNKNIVLTFDDGEKNNFELVVPFLKEIKASAYFFVIVDRIGRDGYLSWEDLAVMRMVGFNIGSHGLTHKILTGLSTEVLFEELTKSKFMLESKLRCSIDSISIPRGFYDDKVIAAAKKAGYKQIFVSDKRVGFSEGCFERIAVKGVWTIEDFVMAVTGKIGFKMKLFTMIKTLVRRVFGDRGYDKIRGMILKKR
ncbi:MAG: polysaccharide deacetylase family protein [Candidatus Omnitrophica bacterium]|nr:polysaccharide deacetylase family protein [Candidatus Omnitrophota bacterium]